MPADARFRPLTPVWPRLSVSRKNSPFRLSLSTLAGIVPRRGRKKAELFGLSKKVRIFAVPNDARMAEFVDALLSGGSVRKDVSVRL